MVKLILIIIFTILNLLFNWWISLRAKRYHAIFRFFAFECIFLLVLMNYRDWFHNPFSLNQVISWLLLSVSIYAAFVGLYLFYKLGKPEDQLEETINLVTTGIYRYIRHPMYLSLILVGFGAMMKDPGYVQVFLGIINLIALFFTARIEENEMIAKFGEEYKNYMKRTKMFMPFIL